MNSFQENRHAIVDSITEDLFPTEEALPNAEAVVTELLASNKSLATVEEKPALQQEIKELRAQTAMGNPESEGNKKPHGVAWTEGSPAGQKGDAVCRTPASELGSREVDLGHGEEDEPGSSGSRCAESCGQSARANASAG